MREHIRAHTTLLCGEILQLTVQHCFRQVTERIALHGDSTTGAGSRGLWCEVYRAWFRRSGINGARRTEVATASSVAEATRNDSARPARATRCATKALPASTFDALEFGQAKSLSGSWCGLLSLPGSRARSMARHPGFHPPPGMPQ